MHILSETEFYKMDVPVNSPQKHCIASEKVIPINNKCHAFVDGKSSKQTLSRCGLKSCYEPHVLLKMLEASF